MNINALLMKFSRDLLHDCPSYTCSEMAQYKLLDQAFLYDNLHHEYYLRKDLLEYIPYKDWYKASLVLTRKNWPDNAD